MKFYVLADGEFKTFDNKAESVEVALDWIETYREMARQDNEWPDAVESVKVVMSDISFDGESHDAMIAAADELDRLDAAVTGLSETDPLKMTLAILTRQYDQHDRVWNIIEEQRKTIAEMQKTIDMLRMHPLVEVGK